MEYRWMAIGDFNPKTLFLPYLYARVGQNKICTIFVYDRRSEHGQHERGLILE